MIRDAVKNHYVGMNAEFRYRGEEPTRIETLSDAGFALAIGLLLISTTAPTDFKKLVEFTKDLIPFALCITLIMLVWYEHFKFFIRYGFRNVYIVMLNTLLLLIILFYVYPLKFLAKLLVGIYGAMLGRLLGFGGSIVSSFGGTIDPSDMPVLMVIYGLGAAGIFLTLALMYRYAYKKAAELDLNEIEIFDTKVSIYSNVLLGSVPLFSIALAVIIPHPAVASAASGFSYFLYWPVMWFYGKRMDSKRKLLLQPKDII